MKSKIVRALLTALFLLSFAATANALPDCRDCSAESDACYSVAEANKVVCILDAQTARDLTLLAITNAKNAQLSGCDSAHENGSIAHSACVAAVVAAASANEGAAWATYQVLASLCRSAERFAKNDCDDDYRDCLLDVATDRANCLCE